MMPGIAPHTKPMTLNKKRLRKMQSRNTIYDYKSWSENNPIVGPPYL